MGLSRVPGWRRDCLALQLAVTPGKVSIRSSVDLASVALCAYVASRCAPL